MEEQKGIKVLMISTDRRIFDGESAVCQRMKEYGSLVGELHIVVFAKKSLGFKEKQISQNVWAYSTSSFSKWGYVGDAVSVGKKLIKNKDFVRGLSLVTTQDPFETGLAGLKISRRWRIPLQVQIHTDFLDPYFKDSSFLNWYRFRISKKILKKANTIRVVSENIKDGIVEKFGIDRDIITVLPIWVDLEEYKSARIAFDLRGRNTQWSFIILMVSRITKEKNISFALDVFREIVNRFPRTGMVIVGDGDELSSLKRKAKHLGLEKNINFEGWQEKLTSYYKTASMFLLTSVYEGYGMTLVEAGASMCPIVTSQVGIAKSFAYNNNALICPVNDKNCFVEAIAGLIESNQVREELKTNMMHYLEKNLISKEEYLSRYKTLLEAGIILK